MTQQDLIRRLETLQKIGTGESAQAFLNDLALFNEVHSEIWYTFGREKLQILISENVYTKDITSFNKEFVQITAKLLYNLKLNYPPSIAYGI